MLETGITPDFIVIDGKEGGTGAAPSEFTDHIGQPLREGLNFVHNALIGAGLRDRIKLGASGKIGDLYQHFGITPAKVAEAAQAALKKA